MTGESSGWFALAASPLCSLLLLTACGDGDNVATSQDNVLANGGFEDGREPWYSLKPPDFEISEDVKRSGNAAAYLPFQAAAEEEDNKIYYLVQEVTPERFPELLSGYYRVDKWEAGTPDTYLQVVVVVFGADNLAQEFPNHQIRYIFAGLSEPPFGIANAEFRFLTTDEPVTGEWVPFEIDVAADFAEVWGAVPEGYDNIRMLFEVRYDNKVAGDGAVNAEVYYDDLYMGPASAD